MNTSRTLTVNEWTGWGETWDREIGEGGGRMMLVSTERYPNGHDFVGEGRARSTCANCEGWADDVLDAPCQSARCGEGGGRVAEEKTP